MAQFLLYTGVSEDPQRQTVRLVEGESLETIWAANPAALCVQEYTEPTMQEAPDEKKLRRGMIVQS